MVRRVKFRDRGAVAADGRILFTSAILPLFAQRTRSLDAVLPVLYDRPAEHWVHSRTTNPIESVFDTVRPGPRAASPMPRPW
jgi:hypothetical protein